MDVWGVAQPIMEEVVARTGESCSASMLDGDDIVYVARVAAGRIMQVGLSVGSRLPAYCSSMGRVLLAALPPDALDAYFASPRKALTARTITGEAELRAAIAQVRACGWSLVDEELEIGLRSLAVPLHRRSGQVIAAMNISCAAGRETAEQTVARCLPVLCNAATRISRGIAG